MFVIFFFSDKLLSLFEFIYKVTSITLKTLKLDEYFPALLLFLSNKMSLGAHQLYSELFDITVTDWRVISLLALEPEISAKRVCQFIGLDKGTVSRTIARLAKDHMIEILNDPTDGRSNLLVLSKKGLEIHEQAIEIALEREKKILKKLTKDEVKELIRILNILNNDINDVNSVMSKKYLKTDK